MIELRRGEEERRRLLDAERAARREAAVTGRRRIVFHDRYERVRTIMPPRPAARA